MRVLHQLSAWLARQFSQPARGFSAAAPHEPTVFGARRPGFPLPVVDRSAVNTWITFMQSQQIRRVVCLLPQRQLAGYDQLLDIYQHIFGIPNVCWAPIHDFRLADPVTLTHIILPFLAQADQQHERVVVHCSGGVGRTGHVLAAWLVSFRGLSNKDAIAAVRQMGRNPREARDPGLDQLLDTCRSVFAEQDETVRLSPNRRM
jgi:protein-tyrosine phosphatase